MGKMADFARSGDKGKMNNNKNLSNSFSSKQDMSMPSSSGQEGNYAGNMDLSDSSNGVKNPDLPLGDQYK